MGSPVLKDLTAGNSSPKSVSFTEYTGGLLLTWQPNPVLASLILCPLCQHKGIPRPPPLPSTTTSDPYCGVWREGTDRPKDKAYYDQTDRPKDKAHYDQTDRPKDKAYYDQTDSPKDKVHYDQTDRPKDKAYYER
ncbi:hypothetical protein BaRGS_00024732 [Batillaria attramentaria]|uniref:Uncharacterized protein n=1 Tax=Batillaria attramentaria TaxID=370345 RepID=A0ABD0KA99_9CAEN